MFHALKKQSAPAIVPDGHPGGFGEPDEAVQGFTVQNHQQ
jgi:hypothetical protein